MIGQRPIALAKSFQLRWVKGNEARIHSGGEWQLRFKDRTAHDLANRRLSVEHWRSPRVSPGDEIVYTFVNGTATLPEVLANLVAGGLSEKDIEIESQGARFEIPGR